MRGQDRGEGVESADLQRAYGGQLPADLLHHGSGRGRHVRGVDEPLGQDVRCAEHAHVDDHGLLRKVTRSSDDDTSTGKGSAQEQLAQRDRTSAARAEQGRSGCQGRDALGGDGAQRVRHGHPHRG